MHFTLTQRDFKRLKAMRECGFFMKRITFRPLALIVYCLFLAASLSATTHDDDKKPAVASKPPATSVKPQEGSASAPKILPLDEVKTGMRGVAYTVFEGTKPEPMEVEVLGVLKNMNGPKSDMILIRLHGQKVEYTGVVAGMSGSPVYIDGKLMGALAYRIGTFSKEPIAGVTPIEEML